MTLIENGVVRILIPVSVKSLAGIGQDMPSVATNAWLMAKLSSNCSLEIAP